jgi:hypothetical protein
MQRVLVHRLGMYGPRGFLEKAAVTSPVEWLTGWARLALFFFFCALARLVH